MTTTVSARGHAKAQAEADNVLPQTKGRRSGLD